MDGDEKTRSPSFPSIYVTLVQLQERWLKEKEKERKRREEGEEAAESKPPSRSPEASAPEVGEASPMDDEKVKTPSFPSNYVTLAQLRERWIKEKERKQREEGEEVRRLKQKGLRDGGAEEAVTVVVESKPPSCSPVGSAPQVDVAGDRETKTTVKKNKSKRKGKKKGKSQRELDLRAQHTVAGKEALGELPFSDAEKDGVGGNTRGETSAETNGLEAYFWVSSSNRGFSRGGSRKSHGRQTAGFEAGEARASSCNLEEKPDLETKSWVLSVNAVIRREDERLSRRNGGGGDKVDEPVGKSQEKGRDKGEATSEGSVESRFEAFPGNGESVRKRNMWKGRDKSKGTSRETRAESEIPDLKAEIEPVRDLPEDSARSRKKQIGFVRRTIGDTELESSSVDQTAGIEHKDRALPVRCGAGKRNDRLKDKGVQVRRNEEGVEGRVETGAGSVSSDQTAEIEPNLWALRENGVAREGIGESRRRDKKQDMVWRRTGGETKPKSDALDQTAVTEHRVRALPVNGRAGKRNDRSRMENVRFSRNEEVVGDKDETWAVGGSSDLTAENESGLRNLPVNGLAWEGNERSGRRDKKQEKLARQTGGETSPESNALNPTTDTQEVRAFPVKLRPGKRKEGSRKKGAPVRRNVEPKAESANSDQLVGMETKIEVFSINIVTEEENVGFSRNTEKEEITGIGFKTMVGSESSDPTADIEPGLQALPKNDVAREWIEESGKRGRNQDMFRRKTGGETKPESNTLNPTTGLQEVRPFPLKAGAGKRNERSRKIGVSVRRNVETKAESANSDQLVGMETKFEVFSINIVTEEENVGFRRNTEKEEITGIGFETMAGSESSDPTADIEPGLRALPKNGVAREWIGESGRRGRNQDMFWRKTGGETKPKSDALGQTAGTEQKVRALPINGRDGRTKVGHGRGFRESQSSQVGRYSHRGVPHGRDSGNGMVWVKKDDVQEGFRNQIDTDSD